MYMPILLLSLLLLLFSPETTTQAPATGPSATTRTGAGISKREVHIIDYIILY